MNDYTLIPWAGGQANVTAANTEHRALPMTPLAKGSGAVRYSVGGVYCYQRDEGAWFVRHVPSGEWITELAGLSIGFSSCANARRWTAAEKPVPADWTNKVKSVEVHSADGLAVLKSAGHSVADTVSGEEVTRRIMATGYPITMADAARAIRRFTNDMHSLTTAAGETSESASTLAAGVLALASGVQSETIRRAAEYQARKLKDDLANEGEQDCDWCGPGQPCRCCADSTDPIENIYD